ncbi:hypothetical protein [Natronorarus salvus]|uniref:hypothetical protein n=1 Tax=Natronorarus salvus TaxID=3117733 RepID=UPI002F26347E
MFRKLLVLTGLVEVLAPEGFIGIVHRYACESPEDCELESWVVPAARAEGLCYLYMGLRGEWSYRAFRRFLGLLGLLALFSPRLTIRSVTRLAYADPDGCEWKPWVYPLARLFGAVYLLLAFETFGEGDRE